MFPVPPTEPQLVPCNEDCGQKITDPAICDWFTVCIKKSEIARNPKTGECLCGKDFFSYKLRYRGRAFTVLVQSVDGNIVSEIVVCSQNDFNDPRVREYLSKVEEFGPITPGAVTRDGHGYLVGVSQTPSLASPAANELAYMETSIDFKEFIDDINPSLLE